jgi:hypothetical protein
MNPDSYLFIALPVIGMAGSLALLAYAISLGRRKKEELDEDDDDQPAQEDTVGLEDNQPAQEDAVEVADNQPAQEDAIMDEERPVEVSPVAEESTSSPQDDIFVAELLRNRKTGSLIVKIGEQRYSKASDIKNLETLGRVEDTSEALMQWLVAADIAVLSPEDVAKAKAREAAVKQKTMIEEINEILEQRGEEGKAPLGLRLFEGPEGTVRVYVGVNSYEVDEVPEKKIHGVIKSAVAEWEARQ